ncbi:alpha/beta hydrolase [Leucobacter sp. M11]|uniref:alpha/beta hydrolase n=1 Tax=Leucobacter sp. M11 TaxID=2993565 RepID=UPI002D7F88E3|nr:alpha/beta hydrolase [Leucobacter sp. M11]MEB4616415.1 alpha/beta hydrolase [Leucobacter sp. M11]
MMSYEFDPEVAAVVPYAPPVDLRNIVGTRQLLAEAAQQFPAFDPGPDVSVLTHSAPGVAGAPAVDLIVVRPASAPERAAPALLWFHGGGFVLGDAKEGVPLLAAAAREHGVIGVSVQYRLAPEHRYPAPIADGESALRWVLDRSGELGIDPEQLFVGGQSAGAAHAVGLALKLRDSGGPRFAFQLLDIPVVTDRTDSPSARDYHDTPVWHRSNAELSWDAYLGEGYGTAPEYAAPARADSLAGLPPTFLSVNQYDPLRDDGIEFARRLAHEGIATELHLYPGTFHGSAGIALSAGVSARQNADLLAALGRAVRVETLGQTT